MRFPRSFFRLGALGVTLAVALGAPLAAQATDRSGAGAEAARTAYFAGDVQGALDKAKAAGEHWINGLAAFRLKQYSDAEAAFDRAAHDAKASDGARAASAYWASRAAAAAGHDAKAAEELKLAAASPHTFYGMIAERKLKLDAGADTSLGAKAKALMAKFPTPALNPNGGFTVEKALVYAIVRQESRFRADAQGGSAMGLMQITPGTAARLGGSKAQLKDPGANLKIGQTYIAKLLGGAKGDVMKALAGWNTGSVKKTGVEGDSLLAMESTPGASTRSFVQNVMVAYWSYQHIFAGGSDSLDAAARGKPMAVASLN